MEEVAAEGRFEPGHDVGRVRGDVRCSNGEVRTAPVESDGDSGVTNADVERLGNHPYPEKVAAKTLDES